MKTDLDKFLELYKSIGIEPKVEETNFGKMITIESYQAPLDSDEDYDGNGIDQLEGYPGFYTTIKFDESGKFIKQGFWE